MRIRNEEAKAMFRRVVAKSNACVTKFYTILRCMCRMSDPRLRQKVYSSGHWSLPFFSRKNPRRRRSPPPPSVNNDVREEEETKKAQTEKDIQKKLETSES